MVDRRGIDHHRIEASDAVEPGEVRIAWGRFEDQQHGPSASVADDPVFNRATPLDGVRLGGGRSDTRSELLAEDAPLDDRRIRVDVSALHPDRLEAARPDEQLELKRAYRADPSPETLARGINPGYHSDDSEARRGRLMNCADCARAFQEGLEGRPRVASRIDDRGLPSAGQERAFGEHRLYTEQWAGARGEPMGYAEVERQVRDRHGSAIVFGYGPDGGHAFNAYWDADRSKVRWADGQIGGTGNWESSDHRIRWPHVEAIVFDRGGRST